MSVKEEISIKDFESSETDTLIHNNKKSVISHYLHNKGTNTEKYYKEDAKSFLQEFREELNKRPSLFETKFELEDLERQLFLESQSVPFASDESHAFKFIDLFAGIGGFRLAFQALEGKCVFSSEWDQHSQKTYLANFGEFPFGDITQEATKKYIPDDFDVLCAGFPCQAFSIAGQKGGFEDTRGTLFFDVAEIIKRKQPKAFFLENVKGLRSHRSGKTLATILNVLRNDLNYFVPEPEIINAKDFGVPQNRERIFIVGFRKDLGITQFTYPDKTDDSKTFMDVREKKPVPAKYYISERYLNTLIKHKERHEAKGNGFGYEIIKNNEKANAIVVGGMGKERNLVIDHRQKDLTPTTNIKGSVNNKHIRKMTPKEWAGLQGFPNKFIIDEVADVHIYKQFGNSVAVPAIQATAKEILKTLEKHYENAKTKAVG